MTTLNSRFRTTQRRRFTLSSRRDLEPALIAWCITGIVAAASFAAAIYLVPDHRPSPLDVQIAARP